MGAQLRAPFPRGIGDIMDLRRVDKYWRDSTGDLSKAKQMVEIACGASCWDEQKKCEHYKMCYVSRNKVGWSANCAYRMIAGLCTCDKPIVIVDDYLNDDRLCIKVQAILTGNTKEYLIHIPEQEEL